MEIVHGIYARKFSGTASSQNSAHYRYLYGHRRRLLGGQGAGGASKDPQIVGVLGHDSQEQQGLLRHGAHGSFGVPECPAKKGCRRCTRDSISAGASLDTMAAQCTAKPKRAFWPSRVPQCQTETSTRGSSGPVATFGDPTSSVNASG